ncbi:MAG TPA: efflux transporter outer membrane subunit [Burkholderiaceae bacterium]|jgi:NodT family efflux transporter outer membrane factor (OMF) lipoprotein
MGKFRPNFQRQHLKPALATVIGTLLLSACASYKGIAPTTTAIGHVDITAPTGIAQSSDVWPQDNWWLAYGDSQLNQLMQHALANSPTLASAQSRIARAQAALALNKASPGLQANVDANASYGRQSGNYIMPKPPLGIGGTYVSQGQAMVDFGYDLDLWGKSAALIHSAEAQANAAKYDHDAARLALTTSIARAYSQLAAQYELQDVLLDMQKQRETILDLTQKRLASGLDTQVELKQSETSTAALRIELIQLETAIEVTRLQLAALAGDMPTASKNIARPTMTNASFTIPQTLPIDLLARRPELAAQRARISATVDEAQAAKALFYPNINLTAFLGFQSIGLNKLLQADSYINSAGPAIHLPIFDSGRLRANYAGKTADIDGAITQYNQSVVTAAQEVAEQLTRIASLSREEEATRDALASAEEAYRLAMLRYKGNLSPYLTALTVETQLLAQKRAAVDVKAKHQDLQIALVRALGGGFIDNAIVVATNKQQ